MPALHRRQVLALGAVAALSTALAACGSGDDATGDAAAAGATTDVLVAAHTSAPFTPTTITAPRVDAVRAKVPKAILDSGELRIGVGALPSGFPPLVFVGTDQRTLTGSEPDLARLVAAVLGLRPVIANATWENMFIGFDSGRTDVGFSNITVTEQRKQKYDFASYRQDNLAFEVRSASAWTFGGDYRTLAGLRVAVGSGTNQEKILLEWRDRLKAEGKDLTPVYLPDQNSIDLALAAGRIDAYFGPNPGIQYHVAQDRGTASATRGAGTWSGAGGGLQGLIAATTKKGNGLVQPVAEALDYLITNGQYGRWLAAYDLRNEAVTTAQVNPPGLPLTNS